MFDFKHLLGWELYESEIDRFMKKFDQDHPALSYYQLKEKEKYSRIHQLRDDPQPRQNRDEFWNNF